MNITSCCLSLTYRKLLCIRWEEPFFATKKYNSFLCFNLPLFKNGSRIYRRWIYKYDYIAIHTDTLQYIESTSANFTKGSACVIIQSVRRRPYIKIGRCYSNDTPERKSVLLSFFRHRNGAEKRVGVNDKFKRAENVMRLLSL